MKAVLEFSYPEDEVKLRRALSADKFADALLSIKNEVRKHFKYEANSVDVLHMVRELVDETLLQAGEEI